MRWSPTDDLQPPHTDLLLYFGINAYDFKMISSLCVCGKYYASDMFEQMSTAKPVWMWYDR